MSCRIFFLFCFFIFCLSSAFGQTKRYVSISGNDSWPGTITMPWRTIQKACNSSQPGDSVFVRSGTYAETVTMGVSGTSVNPITFINYPTEVAIINGSGTNTMTELMRIAGRSYIRIVGLVFTNAKGNFSKAIIINNGSHHIDIVKNKISAIDFSTTITIPPNSSFNSSPLIIYGDNPGIACSNILIKGNEIFNCKTGYSEAITANGNVDGFTIDSNYVHHIANIGIDIAGGWGVSTNAANDFARNGVVSNNIVDSCVSPVKVSAGIYIDGARNNIVYGNTVTRSGRGFMIGCENAGKIAENILVRDNIAYYNKEAGFALGHSTGTVRNCQVVNNTSYANFTINDLSGHAELDVFKNTGCRIENNIFYPTSSSNRAVVFVSPQSLNDTLNYNLYFNNSGTLTFDHYGAVVPFSTFVGISGYDANSLVGNPAFADTIAKNFRLTVTSAAIDKGNQTYAPGAAILDFYGGVRKIGVAVDCGADESDIVTGILQPVPLQMIHAFPNPANDYIDIKNDDYRISKLNVVSMSGQVYEIMEVDGMRNIRIHTRNYSRGVLCLLSFNRKGQLIGISKHILQ